MNFLEQLVAEWYQYNGYFVRTNVKFGRRPRGGYTGEMDVVAYEPNNSEFVHIETSTDSDSWAKREKKFSRKFRDAKTHYRQIFPFKSNKLRQVAIVGTSSNPRRRVSFGDRIEIISIPEFMRQITEELSQKNPWADAIPETYPLLRAIQYSAYYSHRTSRN